MSSLGRVYWNVCWSRTDRRNNSEEPTAIAHTIDAVMDGRKSWAWAPRRTVRSQSNTFKWGVAKRSVFGLNQTFLFYFVVCCQRTQRERTMERRTDEMRRGEMGKVGFWTNKAKVEELLGKVNEWEMLIVAVPQDALINLWLPNVRAITADKRRP